MVDLPDNFSSGNKEIYCSCGEREVMSHIYDCKILNRDNCEQIPYLLLYKTLTNR